MEKLEWIKKMDRDLSVISVKGRKSRNILKRDKKLLSGKIIKGIGK